MRSWALTAALVLATACVDRSNDTPHRDQAPPAQDKPTVEEARVEREPPPRVEPTEPTQPEPVQAPRDSASVVERGEVVATLQLPSGTATTDLALAAENVQPGISQLLRNQAPALLRDTIGVELAGVKLESSIALLLVDPTAHELPLALLVEVDDLDALREAVAPTKRELRERDGFALIGPPAVVAAVEHYAFEHLRAAPDHSELVLYPASMAKLLGPQLRNALAQMPIGAATLATLEPLGNAIDELITQTDRVVLSVVANSQSTNLFIRVYPRPNTALQAFTAAQVPASHELLSELPATNPALIITGALRAGAAAGSLIDALATSLSTIYDSDAQTLAAGLRAWSETVDGRVAFSVEVEPSGAKIWGAYGTRDDAAARAAWRGMMEIIALTATGPVTISYQRDVGEHDGITIDRHSTSTDTSQLPVEVREQLATSGQSLDQHHDFAVFDGMLTIAPQGKAPQLIDAARGQQASLQLSGGAAGALAISTAFGESAFYYVDFSRVDAQAPNSGAPFSTMVMAFGKHDDALGLRLSMIE